MEPRVLFLREKQRRTRPSHSLKFTGGTGFLGTILTTLESTLGGGLKLFLPTLSTCSTRASRFVFAARRQYWESPGLATSRSANSRWNMTIAERHNGLCASSLKTIADEIWYGTFATQRSK
eukprot:scaffold1293_cov375-Prasinococcus_capsulatus_cf.AAC.13